MEVFQLVMMALALANSLYTNGRPVNLVHHTADQRFTAANVTVRNHSSLTAYVSILDFNRSYSLMIPPGCEATQPVVHRGEIWTSAEGFDQNAIHVWTWPRQRFSLPTQSGSNDGRFSIDLK